MKWCTPQGRSERADRGAHAALIPRSRQRLAQGPREARACRFKHSPQGLGTIRDEQFGLPPAGVLTDGGDYGRHRGVARVRYGGLIKDDGSG